MLRIALHGVDFNDAKRKRKEDSEWKILVAEVYNVHRNVVSEDQSRPFQPIQLLSRTPARFPVLLLPLAPPPFARKSFEIQQEFFIHFKLLRGDECIAEGEASLFDLVEDASVGIRLEGSGDEGNVGKLRLEHEYASVFSCYRLRFYLAGEGVPI